MRKNKQNAKENLRYNLRNLIFLKPAFEENFKSLLTLRILGLSTQYNTLVEIKNMQGKKGQELRNFVKIRMFLKISDAKVKTHTKLHTKILNHR